MSLGSPAWVGASGSECRNGHRIPESAGAADSGAPTNAARGGDPNRYDFPVGLKDKNNLDFSFSGLKTSLLYKLKAMDEEEVRREMPCFAAGYEAAVVEALTRKLMRAADLRDVPALVVVGGVAANASLRRRVEDEAGRRGLRLVVPPPELCTDNAAMIGAAAAAAPAIPCPDYLSLNARSV